MNQRFKFQQFHDEVNPYGLSVQNSEPREPLSSCTSKSIDTIINPQVRKKNQVNPNLVIQKQTMIETSIPEPKYKKVNLLKVILLVSTFITRMKFLSSSLRFKYMDLKVYQYIADSSSDFQFYCKNSLILYKPTQMERFENWLSDTNYSLMKTLSNFFLFIISDRCIINPGSKILLYWDVIQLLLTILNIMYIPIMVAYETHLLKDYYIHIFFSLVPSIFFTLDIFISIFKGQFHNGLLVTNKKFIIRHYVTNDLLVDIFIVVPFFLEKLGIQYTNYMMLIRITRVHRMIKNFEQLNNFQEGASMLYDLCTLIYLVLMVSHFCACGWSLIARIEKELYPTMHTWEDEYGISYADWTIKYNYAIYWTIVTAMTTGYGDIVPQTNIERTFVTLVVFVVSGMFAYAVSQIGSIFNRVNDRSRLFKDKIYVINSYIDKRGLDPQLQQKVKKYFEFYMAHPQDEQIEIENVMNLMNQGLRTEVMENIYWKILKKSEYFRQNFSQDFLFELCHVFKERTYKPCQIVFQEGQILDDLIFILQGQIQTFCSNNKNGDQLLKTYEEKGVVGEKQFFLDTKMLFSAKAMNFVQVAYVKKEDFLNILKKYPQDYQVFCWKRDYIKFSKNSRQTIACEICCKMHPFENCPFVFSQTNKEKIINIVNSTEPHLKRQYFKRRNQKTPIHPPSEAALFCVSKYHPTNENLEPSVLSGFGMSVKSITDILNDDNIENTEDSLNSLKLSPLFILSPQNNKIPNKRGLIYAMEYDKHKIKAQENYGGKNKDFDYALQLSKLRRWQLDSDGKTKVFSYTDDRPQISFNVDQIQIDNIDLSDMLYFPHWNIQNVEKNFNDDNFVQKEVKKRIQIRNKSIDKKNKRESLILWPKES